MASLSTDPQPSLVVVTDLDGTLLDHHTYSYQPALPALRKLGVLRVPVVLCSSKTRAEIEQLRQDLDNCFPFVVENGAAVFGLPGKNGAGDPVVLGRPYGEIIAVLEALRHEQGFEFTGFNDMTVDEVRQATGLSAKDACLAQQREFSEPLLWRDSPERREQFCQLLAARGFNAQQGGRFLTVAGATDKGRAVATLRQHLGSVAQTVVVLGDSPNDAAMLNAADIAVVIKSDQSDTMAIDGPQQIIHTQERGPAGWNSAILKILEDDNHG